MKNHQRIPNLQPIETLYNGIRSAAYAARAAAYAAYAYAAERDIQLTQLRAVWRTWALS